MTLARLHAVTDDGILAADGFVDRARALLSAGGPAVALHLRGPGGPVRGLLAAAEALAEHAAGVGALLVVNGRPDVALAAEVGAVQLGHRSIPVQAARSIMGPEAVIGYSAHGAHEAASAAEAGADFVVVGTIWATASHPEREGAGLDRVSSTVAAAPVPVIAIGGVTPARAREAVAAGAWGVAAIRGIWENADPAAAAGTYLRAMGVEGQ